MASWGDLPRDLLRLIIRNLDLSDHIPFSGVNANWRFIGIEYRETKIPSNVTGLIIPGGTDTSCLVRRCLSMPLSAEAKRIINNSITRAVAGEDLAPISIPHLCLCRGSYKGWLALVDNSMNMFLQNPYLRQRIQLPPVTKLPVHGLDTRVVNSIEFSKWVVRKVILSASPSSLSRGGGGRGFFVMVFYELPSSGGNIAFCKVSYGGTMIPKEWTKLEGPKLWPWGYVDGVFYKDKLCVVDDYGEVYVSCDIIDDNTLVVPSLCHLGTSISPPMHFVESWYMVEVKGELYQILREYDIEMESNEEYVEPADEEGDDQNIEGADDHKGSGRENIEGYVETDAERYHGIDEFDYDNCTYLSKTWYRCRTYMFRVFKLQDNNDGSSSSSSDQKWIEVKDLNGAAAFLGYNQSFSLSDPTLTGYEKDAIYYAHDDNFSHRCAPTGSDMVSFSLQDSSLSPLYNTTNTILESSKVHAVWMTPTPF